METINYLIPDHTIHAMGWTVVHSLWQGLLVALLLGIYLYRKPAADARRRYLAGFLSLGTIMAAAVVTFFILLDRPEAGLTALFAEGDPAGTVETGGAVPFTFSEKLNENMSLIVLAWLVGMAFFMLKMMGGLLYIQRLKHRHLSAVPAKWEAILGNLKTQIGLSTPVRLSASALVKVPMVVGWLKPVILLPIGAVNRLTAEQVEAILAHELAHIARYDYALNLFQSLAEAVFYFNPAVWWVSANIRTERENCCDDLAVALCGNPLDYARALVSLQEMHEATPAFALSFAAGKNQLLARIRRILNQPHKNPNAMEKFSVIGLALAALIALSVQATTTETLSPTNGWEEISLSEEFEGNEFQPLETDTIPDGTFHYRKKTNGEELEIKVEDGEIKYLEIDGEEIKEEDYGKYEERVTEILGDVPAPPPPPPLPDFDLPVPPAPPSPPQFTEPSVTPAPPVPPAPSAPPTPSPFSRKITTERDGKSTTIIIENGLGTEPIEIEVEGGRRGHVIINGKEIEDLEDGEERIVVEDLFPEYHYRVAPLIEPNHFVFPEVNKKHLRRLERLHEHDNFFVLPNEVFEQEDLDAIIAESMDKHRKLLDKVENFEWEDDHAYLLDLAELRHLNAPLVFELDEKELKAMKEEHEEVQREIQRAQEEYFKALKGLKEKRREQRRQFRRSDGAM